MLRFFFTLLFIAGFLLSAPLFTQGADTPAAPSNESARALTSSQMYDQAKFYFNQLESNTTLSHSRDNWLKGTRSFRKLYLLHPRSEQAPACLYMLGGMYLKMFERFKLGIDLDESISYYKDTYRLFPDHYLADDALFAESQIYFKLKNDPKKASANLERIVSQYPGGDMHSRSAEKLKVLSKDYDLPLPRTLVGSTLSHQLTTIQPVKFWSSPDYVRVVVMADNPVTYTDTLIRKQPKEADTLYIDFQSTYISPELRRKIAVEEGLLKHLRVEQVRTDSVRVNLDVTAIDSYKIFSLPNPFRIIIDVYGKRHAKAPTQQLDQPVLKTAKASSSSSQAEHAPTKFSGQTEIKQTVTQPTPPVTLKNTRSKKVVQRPPSPPREETVDSGKSGKLSLAQQLGLGVRKIVIDPGHGGKDPGAMANQMLEKDIVLEIAQKLRPKLQHLLNCHVILTRNDDTFLTLEERTAIANTEQADLFISLHLNAHQSADSKGLETYYLNLSTNAEAMRVAAMENATSTHQISDLEGILSDILKNSKIDESSRLADLVHSTMLTGLGGKKFGEIKNLGVKQAPFYVLIGAQMPSILIEIAFISNKEEAENLKNAHYLDSVASEIANGVSAYVKTNTARLDSK